MEYVVSQGEVFAKPTTLENIDIQSMKQALMATSAHDLINPNSIVSLETAKAKDE